MGEWQGKIYDQKEHKGLPHISEKNILKMSKTFEKIFCSLMRKKQNSGFW